MLQKSAVLVQVRYRVIYKDYQNMKYFDVINKIL